MALKLYSTLGRETREFRPLDGHTARIYVCGVTPYDVTHLGHAFSYVQFDTLRRYLLWKGWKVRYVQNVTDIDDDMIMVSKREGRAIPDIRDENDAILRADLDRLNVLRPSAYPYATEHIAQIIEATSEILRKGYAYVSGGNVFFNATSFPSYGALNGVSLETLAKRENPEAKHENLRRGPLDFLLWQTVDPGDPSWESPWGPGRPGWSIECTAMSTTHLGSQIDIHGGGSDLVFPHHENEIAQAETATGKHPFCGWWLHNGMLQLDGVKMSKSLGNLVLARELMKTVDPEHLRLYLLSHHYRADANYTAQSLPEVEQRYRVLRDACLRAGPGAPEDRGHPVLREFEETVDKDFDVPHALRRLEAAAAQVTRSEGSHDVAAAIRAAMSALGFAWAGARGPANGDLDP